MCLFVRGFDFAFFFPLGIFLLAFPDAIAFTIEQGDVGMMGEPVQQCGDTGGVWEDSVPILKGKIGRQHDGTSRLVARVDNVEEEVRGIFIVGEITDLVDAK